ncbi:hypothetical protein IAU59_006468 [Kwoniella sp. CBS 9459]
MTTTPVPTHISAEDTSDTPTKRHPTSRAPIPDFNSPSAYLSEYTNHATPDTPHAHETTYDIPPVTDVSVSSSSSITSAAVPQAHHPPPVDDSYGYTYRDFPADQQQQQHSLHHLPHHHQHHHSHQIQHSQHEEYVPVSEEQKTPPAPDRDEEDRTPVVTDIHAQPINLPCPPNVTNNQTIRAPQPKPPLMSPFKTFHDQQQAQQQQHLHQAHHAQHTLQQQSPIAYPLPIEHQQYMDNTAMYYGQPGFIAYPQASPTAHMAFAQYPPQFATMQPQMTGIFPAEMYQIPPQYAFAGPPRSRNGSPTSSIASSAVSLARSASTSSDFRVTRPKVKLTYDDKRTIVELHRQNSSLRQEDIARMYGVDRSTISKIILSSHRWTQPQEPQAPPVPKPPKAVGGRFPAVEAKLDEWMDTQIATGQDVRDQVAREKAKTFAREIGFPMDRFKASAKWLDKFKDRRKAAGKPVTSPTQPDYGGYYPYPTHPYPMMASPLEGGVLLSRSQSTVTLSSSDSSGQELYQTPAYVPTESAHSRMASTRSESDLLQTIDTTPNSRSRSQSSPHVLVEPGMQSPSSGKAIKHRPTPLALQRQNSFHGTSPSPRRPGGLSRTNSIQGSARRQNRPLSLAASAFGFTHVDPTSTQSPVQSPTPSNHSRQRSDVSVSNGFSGMTISPNVSEGGESGMMSMSMSMGSIPPLTPMTPATAATAGVFPNTDYGDIQGKMQAQAQAAQAQAHAHAHAQAQAQAHAQAQAQGHPHFHGHHTQFATMPNKHYGHPEYANPGIIYPPSDFGPAPGYIVQGQQTSWR